MALTLAGGEARAVRPDSPGAAASLLFHFDPGDVVETWDDPGGRIRVHFTRAGDHAVRDLDVDEDGVPDDVARVGATYEEALAFYEDEGFRAPISDAGTTGGDGGDARFDVYLVDFGLSADGNWARERCQGSRCSGYMTQENDFAGYGYPSFDHATRVLASHELFHAVQAAYDADQGANWSEATAVWATERFDPSLDDLEGFAYGWLSNPDRTLDQEPTGPVDAFTYGMGIVATYFSEAIAPALIREVWEGVEDRAGGVASPRWLDVLEARLEARGTSFGAEWTTLAGWALRAGWTSQGSWSNGGQLPLIDKELVDLPFTEDRLRVFRASLEVRSVKPGARTIVAAELVVGADASDELEGMTIVLAARDGARFTGAVAPDGVRAEIDAVGADEVLVAVVNTLTAGESQRPGLCIGSPDEVEACRAALGGVDPRAEPTVEAAEATSDEGSDAGAEAVEPEPDAGAESAVEVVRGGDDGGCAGGGPTTALVLAAWIAVVLVGRWLGRRKGRAAEGTMWAVLFGPIGLVIIAVRRPDEIALGQDLPATFD